MRKQMFIRFSNPETAEWLITGEPEQDHTPRFGTLGIAAAESTGCRVIVLLPSTDVLISQTVVPSRNRQRILGAVPYALEDQVAIDVDQLHFAVGEREDDGRVAVVVIARELMERRINELKAEGIEADVIIPDVFALPLEEQSWAILHNDQGRAIVRTGRQAGFGIDQDNLEVMLALVLQEAAEKKPARIVVYNSAVNENRVTVEDDIEIDQRVLEGTPFQFLVQHFDEKTSVNLLQGGYSRREQLSKLWKPWIPTAAMLGAWFVISVGLAFFKYHQLANEDKLLRQQITQVFKSTFPETTRVVNPQVQMQRALDALRVQGGGAEFLQLLGTSTPHLAQMAGLELTRMSYREGRLDMALVIGDLQRLDQLKQRLTDQAKLNVEIQSAASKENKVEARLQIKGQAS